MDANNVRSNATTNSMTVARGATDDLGPLPPGWQMSKTDNERPFFIDHINKRTTWVKKRNKIIKDFIWFCLIKIDPRTGKPSPQPAAQRELNQNGALPVRKQRFRVEDDRGFFLINRNIGKFEHYRMVECIILIIVRTDISH
jgi:hypothetical protein